MSVVEVYFLAHDPLPTFLGYFPGNKADDAVIHVQGSLANDARAVGLTKVHLLLEIHAEAAFLETQFRRKLL